MAHRQDALPEQLLYVAVAERIAQILADRLQDQWRPRKSSLEQRFSFSAIALRIMAPLRTGGDKVDHHA
jgi:hypothetical protein